jgi:ABC-type Fe3+ transport system substrate-binding protein
MVIVMWKDRYDAFMQKYTAVNFKTLSEALNEQTGWKAIAAKPEWGVFNFGHTKPTHSNSGLLTLVLMGYDYFDLFRDLKIENIMDEGFLTWLKTTESNMSHEEESTGKLMKDMLTRGPAEFSGIMVYENLALTNLSTAEGRWGKIQIVYPTRSVWNDNPFYILDVPWSTSDHRTAAKLFQNFLLSREAQRVARDVYLFRPANLDIPIMDGNTAFDKLKDIVKIDVTAIKRPKAEVLNQLLQVWKKMQ